MEIWEHVGIECPEGSLEFCRLNCSARTRAAVARPGSSSTPPNGDRINKANKHEKSTNLLAFQPFRNHVKYAKAF